jgi:predicted ATPase
VPFIETLKEHCTVHCLNSETDYRLTGEKIIHVYQMYVYAKIVLTRIALVFQKRGGRLWTKFGTN